MGILDCRPSTYRAKHHDSMLDQIVGAQLRAVPDATEIIIRCRSAAKTAYEAADSYGVRITIVAREKNSQES